MVALGHRFRVAVAVAVSCCALATVVAAADVTVVGVWKGSMETQMGPVENTITFDSASPLTGTVSVSSYQGKIEKGTLDGEKIAFQITIEPGTISYEGAVSGDQLNLNVTGTTGNKMTLVAKRQK